YLRGIRTILICRRRPSSSLNCAGGCADAMKNIIDTGPLVYRFDRAKSDVGRWSRELFGSHTPPFFTCEAVLVEAAYMTTPELITRMLKNGDLAVDFSLQEEIEHVHRLLAEYPQMDLADACLVRMSELTPDCQIFTIDRQDFCVYRRFRNKVIPAVFPD